MAHVLDRLVAYDFGRDNMLQQMIDALPRAEMFLADNVYQYFYENPDWVSGESIDQLELHVDFKDFPQLAPPFEEFFIGCNSLPIKKTGYGSGGVMFVARDIMDAHAPGIVQYILDRGWQSRAALRQRGVRWILYAMPVALFADGDIVTPCVAQAIFVKEDGSFFSSVSFGDEARIKLQAPIYRMSVADMTEAHNTIADLLVPPALLALSFIHCRNVEVIETLPNRKQSARREQKKGHGLIKFRTLQIEPMKRALREASTTEGTGLGVALHTCRGHFKDYRDGKGLFGKHKDLYWWDGQERGSPDLGRVLKDYETTPEPGRHHD